MPKITCPEPAIAIFASGLHLGPLRQDNKGFARLRPVPPKVSKILVNLLG